MAPKLYLVAPSPPVRSVLLTAKALGLTLDLVPVNLSKGEQLTPEFLKLNPQHTVPTLDDNGTVIWDSHAINIYLVSKYGKDDSLYPKDFHRRAIINQRLHFDSGVLFSCGQQIIRLIIGGKAKSVPSDKSAVIIEAYGFLETFLEGYQWMAGNTVTLADFHLIPSVTTIAILVPIDGDKFPNLTAWLERAQKLPYYEANLNGLKLLEQMILGALKS